MEKKVLNQAITAIVKRLEKTEKFVLDQAPDICKQMVKEDVTNNVVNFIQQIGGVIVFSSLLALAVIHLNIPQPTEGREHDNFGWWCLAILSSIPTAILIACAIDSLKEIYLTKTCTKLFLLREFKRLIKR